MKSQKEAMLAHILAKDVQNLEADIVITSV